MFGGVAFGGFEIAPLPFRATLDDTGCNFLDLFPGSNFACGVGLGVLPEGRDGYG